MAFRQIMEMISQGVVISYDRITEIVMEAATLEVDVYEVMDNEEFEMWRRPIYVKLPCDLTRDSIDAHLRKLHPVPSVLHFSA
jgi:hypothetical protein